MTRSARSTIALSGNYKSVAPFYDFLARVYSQGGIQRAKNAHLVHLEAGTRIIYAGAGTGEECMFAAQNGALVTIVDNCSAMLDKCKQRFRQAQVDAHFILGDVRDLDAKQRFDFVVAPFFLNVFAPTDLSIVLSSLSRLLAPQGRLISVDFRAPSDRFSFRLFQRAYHLAPLILFYAISRNPWHPLYNYPRLVERLGLPLRLIDRQLAYGWGLPLFESLSFQAT